MIQQHQKTSTRRRSPSVPVPHSSPGSPAAGKRLGGARSAHREQQRATTSTNENSHGQQLSTLTRCAKPTTTPSVTQTKTRGLYATKKTSRDRAAYSPTSPRERIASRVKRRPPFGQDKLWRDRKSQQCTRADTNPGKTAKSLMNSFYPQTNWIKPQLLRGIHLRVCSKRLNKLTSQCDHSKLSYTYGVSISSGLSILYSCWFV